MVDGQAQQRGDDERSTATEARIRRVSAGSAPRREPGPPRGRRLRAASMDAVRAVRSPRMPRLLFEYLDDETLAFRFRWFAIADPFLMQHRA